MNISTMARAFSYIRFSTPEKTEGDSFRRQAELSEEYAKEHKLILRDEGYLTREPTCP